MSLQPFKKGDLSQDVINNINDLSRHRKSFFAEQDHEYSDDSESSLNSFEVDEKIAKHALNAAHVHPDELRKQKSIELSRGATSKFEEALLNEAEGLVDARASGIKKAATFPTRRDTADRTSEFLKPLDSTPSIDIAAASKDSDKVRISPVGKESKYPKNSPLHKITVAAKRLHKLRWRNGAPKSNFSDIKHFETASILESDTAKNSEFWGFYAPFWLGVGVLMISVASHSIREKGLRHAIATSRVVQIFFQDIVAIALFDLFLYLQLFLSFGLQLLVKKNIVAWENFGWKAQSLYEFGYMVFVLWWLEHRQYPWIGKVFLALHSIVFLMKMHSYAFYNGYLWRIKRELAFSTYYLENHQDLDDNIREILTNSIKFCKFELEQTLPVGITVRDDVSAKESLAEKKEGKAINPDFKEISSSSSPLAFKAKSEPPVVVSPCRNGRFPANINLKNFFMYTMFPTVVYEINYPRSPKVRWGYVLTKLLGIFGIISVMITVAQEGVYPQAIKAINMREWPFIEKLKEYPFLLLDLMPSFFLLYILVFFLIWDQILNAIAEVTRFGDRNFYGPWWNCVTWDEFARLWNAPVHKFLLRHVYHGSISALQLSKSSATLMTFLLSALFHEVIMYVIFGKVRFYLFTIQMYQLPLMALSRTKFMKEKQLLGNVMFWIGVASSCAIVCSLYLVF